MAFEFTDECFVAQVWFAAWHKTDWMGIVSRPRPDAPWSALYRFRYYGADPSPFADDKKNWFSIRPKGDEARSDAVRDKLVEAMEVVALTCVEIQGAELWRVPVQGNGPRAIERLRQQPWFFAQVQKDEEQL